MTLKINGSTAGSVSIDAPADTSPTGTDVTLTLPTSAGSSGQYLQTNGSGTLSWQTVAELPDALDISASASADSVNIDSSGRLLVGTSTAAGNNILQLEGSASGDTEWAGISLRRGIASASLAADQYLGAIAFQSQGGGEGAVMRGVVESSWTSSSHPSRLTFETTASGSSSSTERMRIDSSGRLMLGTTTEGHPNADNLTVAGSGHAGITIRSGSTSTGGIFFSDATTGSGEYDGAIEYNQNTQEMILYSAATDRMRITADGDILAGSSSTWGSDNGSSFYIHNNSDQQALKVSNGDPGSSPYGLIGFYRNKGSLIARITTDGSSVSYNTSSDYRLKENVVDLDNAIDRVKQLAPKRFNWIADETDSPVDGFLAHEAQTVVPEAVIGTHNEVDDDGNPVYQGIDQSKLVPLLTAALQEAIAKIETLETANVSQAATIAAFEARLTALEGGAA